MPPEGGRARLDILAPPPNAGAAFVLRGVVDFQWRAKRRTKSGHRKWVVLRTLHANTKGEHPSKVADPPGYTSGTCEIASYAANSRGSLLITPSTPRADRRSISAASSTVHT